MNTEILKGQGGGRKGTSLQWVCGNKSLIPSTLACDPSLPVIHLFCVQVACMSFPALNTTLFLQLDLYVVDSSIFTYKNDTIF